MRDLLCLRTIKSKRFWLEVFGPFLFLLFGVFSGAVAQNLPPPLTPSGLNTQISAPTTLPNGRVNYDITGGTRAGTNLFHSFGEFGVPTNNIANFLNNSGLATTNILGRVSGGNPSSIFGTIQTTNFGNANLFLMNPAGIIFGPNATLNVGGSVTFTTAHYLRLVEVDGTAGIFHADSAATSVLTSAPVASFGFLGSSPGAITVQGSQLSVPSGQNISLVGGNITVQAGVLDDGITIQPARILTPGGQINLASVASPGDVLYPTLQTGSNVNGQSFTSMGNIALSGGSTLDVSANAAGTIRIRGGQLSIADATLSANTVNANGASLAVDVQITGDMSMADTRGVSSISAQTSGTGDAGEVRISSSNLAANSTSSGVPSVVMIDTHTSGEGRAGNVTIATDNLDVTSSGEGVAVFIDSGFSGIQNGHGGDVTITANRFTLKGQSISAGDFTSVQQGADAIGSAGNVKIVADELEVRFAAIITDAGFDGIAGDITLEGRNIKIEGSNVTAFGFQQGGIITVEAKADVLATNSTLINSSAFLGPGRVNISGNSIELSNGSTVVSDTGGDGNAGPINITANDHLTLSGFIQTGPIGRPTGIFSNSLGVFGTNGNAGTITITTPRLSMTDGARINTTTLANGRGGDVIISAQSVSLSGEFPSLIPEPLFSPGTIHAGGITTVTTGESCLGLCGNAGDISITTNSLTVANGAQINSGTSSNGNGGVITIHARDTISMSGILSDGSPGGMLSLSTGATSDAGSGGNIALAAGQSVTILDGASVSASSSGPGNAGNISINAGQQFEMRNSSVKTEAAQASGGNIDIQAIDRIRLVNSSISTSVLGGSGSGGNITIDPNVVILQNSQIIAQAVQGAGGNISITTPLFLTDAGSLVDASSQFGLNGTVNIQSPTSNLAGTVSSLPSSLRQVQSLQTGRCAALADSRSSSLIVAGRDILPAEPGGWSPSHFALIMEQTEPLALASEESSPLVAAMTASADAPVSLRRLTPAGFLTQSFAESGLTGCRA
jgi:filamentous hemagglutinin family protein